MSSSEPGASAPVDPHAELVASFAWMAAGLAILIASVGMDRLESQNINPYTVPGLLPGLLGSMMFVLGGLLALRSWRRGGARRDPTVPRPGRTENIRVAMVVSLCAIFDVVLVGHGLPFWLAAWIFVSGSILILQQASRTAAGERITTSVVIKALAIGLGAGLAITGVFQELFLVRLP